MNRHAAKADVVDEPTPAPAVPHDPDLLIGTSGYLYRHWRAGVFYPKGLPQRDELPYFARFFPTVELNNPFHRLPTREHFAAWRERTPAEFLFAVKASRFITHIKKLKDCEEPFKVFMHNARGLGKKLGPVLFQFPRVWKLNLPRLQDFLKLLPRKQEFAFEFRHPEWYIDGVYEALRGRKAALCLPVSPNLPPPPHLATAGFTYIRMHAGVGQSGSFSEAELQHWAEQIRAFRAQRVRVYVYFNNDWEGFAIQNAFRIRELLDE